jgi:hypothetical protein
MSDTNHQASSHQANGGYNWDNFRQQAFTAADRYAFTHALVES